MTARYSKPEKETVAGENIIKDTPKYKIKLGISYDFANNFSSGLFIDHWADVRTEANVVDVADTTEVYTIESWTKLDLNLTYGGIDWGDAKVDVSVNAENLTNEEYFHTSYGTSPFQIIQPPRTLRIVANIQF